MEPLYLKDAEIGDRLGIAKSDWPRVRQQFESEGLPKPDPITKKRFWPAVEQWLLNRHGISNSVPVPQDGKENWQ